MGNRRAQSHIWSMETSPPAGRRRPPDSQWIKFDFGEPQEIGSLIITWEAAYASDYSIQISDDDAEYTTYSTTPPVPNRMRPRSPSRRPAGILKLTIDKGATGYPCSIYEMEVRDAGNIITALEDTTAETVIGTAPVLPEKVTATYADGKQSDVKVTWNPIPASNYNQVGLLRSWVRSAAQTSK